MARKRSLWMEGLLQCERMIKHETLQSAQFYFDTALQYDEMQFRLGWFDALQHYRRVK